MWRLDPWWTLLIEALRELLLDKCDAPPASEWVPSRPAEWDVSSQQDAYLAEMTIKARAWVQP